MEPPCPYSLVSAKGTIRNETFKTFETRCTFQIKNIEITFPSLEEDDRAKLDTLLKDASLVYWAQMGNFLPIVEYKVEFFFAKQRSWRGKPQFHIDKDNLQLSDRKLMDETAANNLAWKDVMLKSNTVINEGTVRLMQLTSAIVTEKLHQVMNSTRQNNPNLAYTLTALEPEYVKTILNDEAMKIYKASENDPVFLSVRAFLAYYGISINSETTEKIRKRACNLVVLLVNNPYLAQYKDNYPAYRDFRLLSFDKLEKIALERHGPDVVKNQTLIPYRYAAALLSILLEHENNKGSTVMKVEDAKRQLIVKINQSQTNLDEVWEKHQHVITDHLRVENSQEPLLQHLSAKSREDAILSWTAEYTNDTTRIAIKNPRLLQAIIDDVYQSSPRDEKQLEAIQKALTCPVTLISGPPGSGKTTYVLRVITQYLERLYARHTKSYETEYQERKDHDAQYLVDDLQAFMRNIFRKYRITGSIDELICSNSDFDLTFADIYDTLAKKERVGTGKMISVKSFRFICQQKWYNELKRKYYRLSASQDLTHVKMMAPSGVASRRLKDACDGHTTYTCCSLLGQLGEDLTKKETERDFFPFAMMIVDEASMIDESTLTSLITISTDFHCQLLLIGDHNQLPPIGSGQVFRDLLRYSSLASVQLTNIYRQGTGSHIAELSRAIIAGSLEKYRYIRWIQPLLSEEIPVFVERCFEVGGSSEIVGLEMPVEFQDWNSLTAVLYCKLLFNHGYKVADLQILTPFKKEEEGGRAGINLVVQKMVSEERKRQNHGRDINQPHPKFFAMDPVIHRKNARALDIFNGDQGQVLPVMDPIQYAQQKIIPVQYPHQQMNYTTKQDPRIYDLELGYALTAHLAQVKSQYTWMKFKRLTNSIKGITVQSSNCCNC